MPLIKQASQPAPGPRFPAPPSSPAHLRIALVKNDETNLSPPRPLLDAIHCPRQKRPAAAHPPARMCLRMILMSAMPRRYFARYITIATLLCAVSPAQAAVGVRILLGLTDTASAKWDGSVTARGATISSIEPWRFEPEDKISGHDWKISTHEIRLFGGQIRPQTPFVANGVIVFLTGESNSSTLQVKTAQGDFTVALSDIPFGKPSLRLEWPRLRRPRSRLFAAHWQLSR